MTGQRLSEALSETYAAFELPIPTDVRFAIRTAALHLFISPSRIKHADLVLIQRAVALLLAEEARTKGSVAGADTVSSANNGAEETANGTGRENT